MAFVRALEPLALLAWPQKWLDKHVKQPAVFNALKCLLTTDTKIQQLHALRTMVQRAHKNPTPVVLPVDPEGAKARRALERAVETRGALEKGGKCVGLGSSPGQGARGKRGC